MDVLGKPGVALIAAIRFLAGVESHVRLQIARRAKSLPAISTRVRLLA
jgi:hypothetical protein